jgi:ankyrin repeat protein
MSEAMAPSFKEQLVEDPSLANTRDDNGWTFLHHQALAGSLATVNVLLECGADVTAKTNHGMSAIQLAKSLGWDKVIALLASKGATG